MSRNDLKIRIFVQGQRGPDAEIYPPLRVGRKDNFEMGSCDFFHAGPSMHPTLKAGDVLNVRPYADDQMARPGDVIVFCHPNRIQNIAHRIHSVGEDGIRTRGDNNPGVDSWVVAKEDVIGRVSHAQREGKWVTIAGGVHGRRRAKRMRAIKKMDSAVSKIFHSAYRRLARTGILRKLDRLVPRKRILAFTRPAGIEYQLLMGSRVIGKRLPGSGPWYIFRPFRLFVDEASLPIQ